MLSRKEESDAVIWHRRFGHLNYGSLCRMRDGIVTGMKFSNEKIGLQNCEVCAEGKQSREPFKTSQSYTKELLELVHSDLVGPMETKSIGGAKYLLTFIDDYSKKCLSIF